MGLFSGLFGKSEDAEAAVKPDSGVLPPVTPVANDTGKPKARGKAATLVPIMSDDLRNTISRLKGQKPGPDMTSPETLARMFPVSSEIAAEENAKETARRKAAEEAREALKNAQVGDFVPGKGVFIGTKDLKDEKGTSLGVFNLFAAPYDVGLDEQGGGQKLLLKFNDAVKHVAGLHGLLGHDGGDYANDKAVYEAIRKGRYKGEWFIPPKDVLVENLYQNKDKGKLKGTFTTQSKGSVYARWYWSCTERRDDPSLVWDVRFSGGDCDWDSKDDFALSSRPVRAELRP